MHLDATHPLQPLWQLAAAPVLSGALEQALALQLFPLLSTPASAATVAEALAAPEAFLTSTTSFVTGIIGIDGAAIGDGAPGPVTRRLRALYLS
mgnify:CR=1 FL=1